jgi:DNA invertase Pin-like site-specific DNA recombinase
MIGIYTRVSTASQAHMGVSLEIQREKGIAFSKAHGGKYEVFEDAGVSGGTLDREQFQRMLRLIEAGEIDTVWVISKDRLTRASLSEAISLSSTARTQALYSADDSARILCMTRMRSASDADPSLKG